MLFSVMYDPQHSERLIQLMKINFKKEKKISSIKIN